MTSAQLATLFRRIEEHVAVVPTKAASIMWHGGEPLLMGAAFYRDALEHSRRLAERTGLTIRHQMQSNLALLDDELLEVLPKLLADRSIGTSYDPIDDIRRLAGGASYEAEWRRGHARLRAAGMKAGVVYVVHRGSLGRARFIYQSLKDLGLDGGIRFNPMYAAGRAEGMPDLHITGMEFGAFLVDLWDAWNEDRRRLRVDPLRGWAQLASGRPTRLSCAFSGRCTGHFTGIDADGTAYNCGRSVDAGFSPFGNLNTASLQEIYAAPARRAFLNRVEWLRLGPCAGCPWWTFCHGGCPLEAHATSGDALQKSPWCEGLLHFFNHAFGSGPAVRAVPAPPSEADDALVADLPGGEFP